MSIQSDALDAQIDAWTQEQFAASPDWSVEKWMSVMANLEPRDRGNPRLVTGWHEMTCPPVNPDSF